MCSTRTIELLLTEPLARSDQGDGDAVNTRINILKKLESVIWSLITSDGRSEARLWLCKAISCLSSISPQAQCQVFLELLRSRPRKIRLTRQLLQLVFEKRPHKMGAILAKKNYILESFFKGNQRRILQWFNFAGVGQSEHRKGARALSQFAFVNRDICWEELEWKGKHGQSPAVVATKPHYLLDLDVQRTVENFLENVPEFWSSKELAESVKDGDILHMDAKFFTEYFIDLLYEKDSEEVWEVISDFLLQESFSTLCNHLLLILDENDLCAFLNSLCKFDTLRMDPNSVGQPSYWLELQLSIHNGCTVIDELLLLNAVANQGRQLLRLVRDEEHEEERGKIRELVSEIGTISCASDDALLIECLKSKKADSLRWLALQSWVLQYRLSEECGTSDSWEALFIRSGIKFRKSTSHDLLHTNGILEESGSTLDDEGSSRVRRKKGKTRKRRRYYGFEDVDNDDLEDVENLCSWQRLQPKAESWELSTDDYSCSWSTVDLPEYLAKHCFSLWTKWLCSKWIH